VLHFGLIPVEQRASRSKAKAGERRAPCTRRPGALKAKHGRASLTSTTTTPRPARKGWRDLAAAIGCDRCSETGSRADLHGTPSPLRFHYRVGFTLDQYSGGNQGRSCRGWWEMEDVNRWA